MSISRRVLTRSIAKQLHEGGQYSQLVSQLASFIVTRRLYGQTELIVADIARELAKLGTVDVNVTTARQLSGDLRTEIEKFVRDVESAKIVRVHETIDSELIGGVVIETPSRRFDASVASQLTRLRNV